MIAYSARKDVDLKSVGDLQYLEEVIKLSFFLKLNDVR